SNSIRLIYMAMVSPVNLPAFSTELVQSASAEPCRCAVYASIMIALTLIVVRFSVVPTLPYARTNGENRVIRLESKSAQMVVNISGGGIADFHLVQQQLNPVSWQETSVATGPRWMGHFLCLDRWGDPSEAEKRNGMPFHGEASRVQWEI